MVGMRYLDLHSHSVASDDSRATVEQYLKWIRSLHNRGLQVDGIVLTEHRQFDASADYSDLAREYGVLVLKGSELDTRHGHWLVYGVTEDLRRKVDFRDVHMDPFRLMELAERHGAIAIPAHPGRAGIGLAEWMRQGIEFPGVETVEHLNGGNRPLEAEAADLLVTERRFRGIGGSDAHFVSAIARCMTAFDNLPRTEGELVEALRAGEFRAVRLEEAQR
jgi:predicted metal-dependent phosphoesterase TrpH